MRDLGIPLGVTNPSSFFHHDFRILPTLFASFRHCFHLKDSDPWRFLKEPISLDRRDMHDSCWTFLHNRVLSKFEILRILRREGLAKAFQSFPSHYSCTQTKKFAR